MSTTRALSLVKPAESAGPEGAAAILNLAQPDAGMAKQRYRTLLTALSDPVTTEWLNERWDPDRAIYSFRGSDPCSICAVQGCGKAVRNQRLCSVCLPRFEASGAQHSLDWANAQGDVGYRRRAPPKRCAVVDGRGRRCARPSNGLSQLCSAHGLQRSRHTELDLVAFGALDSVQSFSEPPACSVVDCTWPSVFAVKTGAYVCGAHYDRWRVRKKREPHLTWGEWEPSQVPAGLGNWQLWLGGVGDELRAEVLYLIVHLRDRKQDIGAWQAFLSEARHQGSTCFADVVRERYAWRDDNRAHRHRLADLALLSADLESEWDRDEVRLSVVRPGSGGMLLAMGAITQPWLRTLTVDVLRSDVLRLDNHTLFDRVRAIGLLSKSLSTRADGGAAAGALRAVDIERFVRFLRASGEHDGLIYGRLLKVRQVLNRAHKLGIAGALSPAFNVHEEHIPRVALRQKVAGERAFPDATFKLLMGHDELLGGRVFDLLRSIPDRRGFRAELVGEVLEQTIRGAANFGRRPGELLTITADRIRRTEGGGGALRYDNLKSARTAVWLPIDAREVERVLAYKAELRRHFPGAPESELLLYPRARHHDDGTTPQIRASVSRHFRIWCTYLEAAIIVAKLSAELSTSVAAILAVRRSDVTASGVRVGDQVHRVTPAAQAALTDLAYEVTERYGPDGALFVDDPSPRGAAASLAPERLDALGEGWLTVAADYPTWGLPGEHLGQERISQFQVEFRRFRHTYLQHLVDAGTDIFLVQELADHEQVATTINSYVRNRLVQRS